MSRRRQWIYYANPSRTCARPELASSPSSWSLPIIILCVVVWRHTPSTRFSGWKNRAQRSGREIGGTARRQRRRRRRRQLRQTWRPPPPPSEPLEITNKSTSDRTHRMCARRPFVLVAGAKCKNPRRKHENTRHGRTTHTHTRTEDSGAHLRRRRRRRRIRNDDNDGSRCARTGSEQRVTRRRQ